MSSRHLSSVLKAPLLRAHSQLPSKGLMGLAGMLAIMLALIFLPRPEIFTSVDSYLVPHSLLEIGSVLVALMLPPLSSKVTAAHCRPVSW
ncbi:hypothetical protein [Cobetia crustatorum]|uniref:hypothetical protein n=1 Tax=Cobetia crustatorum TaxID=553385 RepID=UPI000468C127|nr:hypothetical protein [Cobetia crustatorum]